MISDTDFIKICLSLEGPQLVRDLLFDAENQPDGFDFDLLSTILSDCPPEKCLLMLACSAGHICDYADIDPALKLSLKMLAGDVLDDYGPIYLAHLKAKEPHHYEAQIIYMQEDLEAFSELFALAGDLAPTDSTLFQICAVLADQSLAQAECLDETEADIDYADRGSLVREDDTPPALILFSDNVVPFPGLFRKN